MVATIIAYGMSLLMSALTISGATLALQGKVTRLEAPFHMCAIVLFGFLAWCFARLGGM
jgi:hypothetical protein